MVERSSVIQLNPAYATEPSTSSAHAQNEENQSLSTTSEDAEITGSQIQDSEANQVWIFHNKILLMLLITHKEFWKISKKRSQTKFVKKSFAMMPKKSSSTWTRTMSSTTPPPLPSGSRINYMVSMCFIFKVAKLKIKISKIF